MVVRLTGDGSEYVRMLQQAQQETRETAQLVEQQGRMIEGFGDKLKGFAAGAIAYLGSLGIKQWLNETLSAYGEQAKAERQLRAILEVNGREVDKQLDRYRQFAEQMQNVAGAADETTLSMLKQAEAMGVTGANAERAVRNVIAAQAAGVHVGIRQAAMLEQGHLGRLGHMLGDLGTGSEQDKIKNAQDKLTKMFAAAETEGKRTTTQLSIAWNELYKDFGKAFTEVMKPINEVRLAVVNWFRSLSEGSKQAIVVMASVAAGVLAVAAAIATAGFVFNTMFGGIGLIVGVIVTAGAASAYWLSTFESIGNAWEYVKEAGGVAWVWIKAKAVEFWNFIKPIWQAMKALALTAWEAIKSIAWEVWLFIKDVFNRVYEFVAETWRNIFGDAVINWTGIRDFIRDSILMAEFVILNFKAVAKLAWTGMLLGAVIAFEEVKHWLTVVIPAALDWWLDNWQDAFKIGFGLILDFLEPIAENIKEFFVWFVTAHFNVFKSIKSFITDTDWAEVWVSFVNSARDAFVAVVDMASKVPAAIRGGLTALGFETELGPRLQHQLADDIQRGLRQGIADFPDLVIRTIEDINPAIQRGLRPFQIPPRVMSDLERQLRGEFEAQLGALQESWEEFHARRLTEFGLTPEDIAAAEKAGGQQEAAMNRGKKKEMEKFEAVARDSAEAVSRIHAYLERVRDNRQARNAASESRGANVVVAVTQQDRDAAMTRAQQLDMLRQIRDGILHMFDDEPHITLEPVGLG